MMDRMLFYAYCIGLPSSRKIEKPKYEKVAFRVLTVDQHQDHDTVADFRKRHLKELRGLFVGMLRLCQAVGLVKLGNVSLNGTKVKDNASKNKAMSYGRMEKKDEEREAEVRRLLTEDKAVDDAEDAKYGNAKRGDELPKELRFKHDRLRKIKEAMESLDQEAKANDEAKREETRVKELSVKSIFIIFLTPSFYLCASFMTRISLRGSPGFYWKKSQPGRKSGWLSG